jgi:iron complex outermembrane recepter protein
MLLSCINPFQHKQHRLFWFALSMSMTMLAQPATAQDMAKQQFTITGQSLQSAIGQLSNQADLEITYPSHLVSGLVSPGLKGRYTAQEALNLLLVGTGLKARVDPDNTYTLEKAPVPYLKVKSVDDSKTQPHTEFEGGEGQLMPKVTVEADSEYDPEYYTDPYNKDYVLPNSSFGTKTDTPIMETPLNAQTVSKQMLKDRQAVTLKDALRNVSGVTNNANLGGNNAYGNNTNITIRGFQTANISRNGVRQQNSAGSGRQLANVESVDVLKGPAAILMGLVDPGGMVNVNTKQPLATPYYGFTQQFGSYDFYRTTLDATGPLTKAKDLLYRINLSYENSGSFRDFVGNDEVFLAPSLKWVISPKTQVSFDMEYDHQHQARDMGYFIPKYNLVFDPVTGLSGQPILDSNGKPPKIPISRNYAGYVPFDSERIFGSFNWSHQFNDDWTLKHRFSVDHNQDASQVLNFPALSQDNTIFSAIVGIANDNTTYSTNLDLTGHFDTLGLKHTLLTGGDYYRTDSAGILVNYQDEDHFPFLDRQLDVFNPVFPAYYVNADTGKKSPSIQAITGPLPPISSLLNDQGHTDQYGLYIQDQIKLPYDVHVTGGIRYQYIHQNNITDGNTNDAVTPRVGILWQPQNWLSLYAMYTESFGANNGWVFLGPGKLRFLKPTSAENYEGGIKTEFFGGKLRATLSYFDLTQTNVAVADPNHLFDCFGFPCSLEVGAIRSRGPELDIQGEILPGWNVIANWSNTDIRVVKSNSAGDGIDGYKVGDRQPSIPRNIGRLWNTYEIQSGDFQGLSFGGGLNFTNGATEYKTNRKLPGYITADLMASYSRKIKDVTLSFQFNVDNLLDKRYVSSSVPSELPFGSWQGIGTPRTFMGQVSVQY